MAAGESITRSKVVPVDKDKTSIYYKLGELLHAQNNTKMALYILDDGILNIPVDKGLSVLFEAKAKILRNSLRPGEALSVLLDGIDKIPADKGLDALYCAASDVFVEIKGRPAAVKLLDDGIEKVGVWGGDKLIKLREELSASGDSEENSDFEGCRFLVFATEWMSKRGGLSTFNRNLCKELAKHGVLVTCVVPNASDEDIADAHKYNVCLISAPPTQSGDPLNGLYRKLQLSVRPDVLIGHGRITGPAAKVQVEDNFPYARRIHFIHMAPGEIEWFKGKDDAALIADARERDELSLAATASVVAAVGPRLYREVGNLIQALKTKPTLLNFIPGIVPLENPRNPPPQLHCLVLGRAEDIELKGLDIASMAIGKLTKESRGNFECEPELIVRGAPEGTGQSLRSELKRAAHGFEPSIRVREYSSNETDVEADINRASLLLMPSRREGFGLVALEALSLGTPILVSEHSGIAEVIKSVATESELARIVIKTSESAETASDAWAKAIEFQIADCNAAFSRANNLAKIISNKYSWSLSIKELLHALGNFTGK